MPRRRSPVPKYTLHKSSGQARVCIGTREVYLGVHGSPESIAAYNRLIAELKAVPDPAAPQFITPAAPLIVDQVLLAFWHFAEEHYRRPDGTPTDTLAEYRQAFGPHRELYGSSPAAEFGPLALKAVRQRWVDAGLARSVVNARVGKIRHVFKWAVAEQLVGPAVYQALAAVAGLQRGRSTAREPAPVGPVEPGRVEAALPLLNRHVRGLVEFQRLTGCRPGEACALRRCDLDMTGPVWLYRPVLHKNSHRGKSRTSAIGPKAQELLRGFFTTDLGAYLFSPARAVEEIAAGRAAARKTPRYRSHMARNAAKRIGARRIRPPTDRYTRGSYETAVDRACDRAFPPPAELAPRKGESRAKWWARLAADERAAVKRWWKAHRRSPNQLRHAHATAVRKRFGLEAAQVVLGHERADVTQVYAEKNLALAVEVAAAVG